VRHLSGIKQRLQSDADVRPLIAEYVPVEIDTESPECKTWIKQHPVKGKPCLAEK